MILTVKQANEKECRAMPNTEGLIDYCVADVCMNWRFSNETVGGYCGLAGKP